MTPKQFVKAGRRLCGHGWQGKLAKEFRKSPRTIRRWVAGEHPIPVWVERFLTMTPAEREHDRKFKAMHERLLKSWLPAFVTMMVKNHNPMVSPRRKAKAQ